MRHATFKKKFNEILLLSKFLMLQQNMYVFKLLFLRSCKAPCIDISLFLQLYSYFKAN